MSLEIHSSLPQARARPLEGRAILEDPERFEQPRPASLIISLGKHRRERLLRRAPSVIALMNSKWLAGRELLSITR